MNKSAQKILVIDDAPDFLAAVTPILKSALYEVVTATNPKEAKEKIFSQKPDLVLLDIMMDSLFDGFSLFMPLRHRKNSKTLRIHPLFLFQPLRKSPAQDSSSRAMKKAWPALMTISTSRSSPMTCWHGSPSFSRNRVHPHFF